MGDPGKIPFDLARFGGNNQKVTIISHMTLAIPQIGVVCRLESL